MKIIREIARGGFGVVEEVESLSGERVARKTFGASSIADPVILEMSRKRFIREVKVLKDLESEFFTPVLDCGLDSSRPWYTMPLASRNFLLEIQECRKLGKTPWEALLEILDCLSELHQAGYSHRDLKPQNILLFGERWKLADFGFISAPADSKTTLLSSTYGGGTLEYMAPEQQIKLSDADFRSDIFSFGCILHDCLSGSVRVPFIQQSVPGPFNQIVMRCTELKPTDRFNSVTELKSAIEKLLALNKFKSPEDIAYDWLDRLQSQKHPDHITLREFISFLKDNHNSEAKHLILLKFNINILKSIQTFAPTDAPQIVEQYCSWAHGSFRWDECDNIGDNLFWIYANFEVDVKAMAVATAAVLGHSHNRFSVMRKVAEMCSAGIHDDLCDAIIGRIMAHNLITDFKICIDMYKNETRCHPKIAQALEIE